MGSSGEISLGNTGPLPRGTVLQERYQIDQVLGAGGMGVVYLASDRRLADRSCAIKEMLDQIGRAQ